MLAFAAFFLFATPFRYAAFFRFAAAADAAAAAGVTLRPRPSCCFTDNFAHAMYAR